MKKFILFVFVLISVISFSEVNAFGFKKANSTEEAEVQMTPEQSADNLLNKNDANKDGKISKNEVNTRFRLRRFKFADKNADGFLDREELLAWFQQIEKVKQK